MDETFLRACVATPSPPEPPLPDTNPNHAEAEAQRATFLNFLHQLGGTESDAVGDVLRRGAGCQATLYSRAWASLVDEATRILCRRVGRAPPSYRADVGRRVAATTLGAFEEAMESWDQVVLPWWPPRGEWGDFHLPCLGVDARALREWPSHRAPSDAAAGVFLARPPGPSLEEVKEWADALGGWSESVRRASEAQVGWDLAHQRLISKSAELEGPVPRHLFQDTIWGAVTRFDTRGAPEPRGADPENVEMKIAGAPKRVLDAALELIFVRWLGGSVANEMAKEAALDRAMDDYGRYVYVDLGIRDVNAIYIRLMHTIHPAAPFSEDQIFLGRTELERRRLALGPRPALPEEPVLRRAFIDGHLPSSLRDRQGQRRVTLEVARARLRRAALGLAAPDG